MRIAELSLAPFGHLRDLTIQLPNRTPDLILLYGRNAAGKSTVREAISCLIFGVPQTTSQAHQFDRRDLRIGARLERDGAQETFWRRSGRKDTLRLADGTPVSGARLQEWLDDVDRDTFERSFSLSGDGLRAGGREILAARDDIGRLLFEASAGLTGLGPVLEDLQRSAEALFSTGRAKQSRAFDQAKSDFDAATKREREATLRPETYAAREAEVARTQAEQAALETALREVGERRLELQRQLKLVEPVRQLERLRAQLADLGPQPELPDDAAELLTRARRDIEESRIRKERITAEYDEAAEHLAQLPADTDLLGHAGETRALIERAQFLQRRAGELEGIQHQVQQEQARALRALAGAGATADQLDGALESLPPPYRLDNWLAQCRRRSQIAAELAEARTERDQASVRLHEAEAALAALGSKRDARPLKNLLSQANRWRQAHHRRTEEASALAELHQRLTTLLEQGGMADQDLNALRNQQAPGESAIQTARDRQAQLTLAVAEAQAECSRLRSELAGLEAALKRLDAAVEGVTDSDLDHARRERDAQWLAIREGEPLRPGDKRASSFEAAIARADQVGDQRLRQASDLARRHQLQADATRRAAELAGSEARLAERRKALASEQESWRQRLLAGGLGELTPDDLPDWLAERQTVLDLAGELAEREAAQGQREADLAGHRDLLLSVLHQLDAAPPAPAPPLDVLLEWSAARYTDLREREAQRPLLERDLAETAQTCRAAEQAMSDLEQALTAVDAELVEAESVLNDLLGPTEIALPQRLDLVAKARRHWDEAHRLHHEHLAPTAEAATRLTADTIALAARLGLSACHHEHGGAFLFELENRLKGQERAQATRDHLTQRLASLAQQARDNEQNIASARARLEPLLARTRTQDLEALAHALAQAAEARRLEQDTSNTADAIARIAPGVPLADIINDMRAVDPAALTLDAEAVEREDERLRARQRAADQAFFEAKRQFEECLGAGDAADARADQLAAEAAMMEAVDLYLHNRLQEIVLRWALDRFRDEAQDPLLARAANYFRKLSLGEFTDLEIDPIEREPTLLARRPDGQRVGVAGLSDGTRDQLFLALRLAALDRDLTAGRRLPFIADDLFERFSDDRAKAGLDLLAELAERTQVLVFTHHQHLTDLAEATLGTNGLTLVNLDGLIDTQEMAETKASA